MYARLVRVKRQLTEPEKHLILGTRGGLSLRFLEPVLLPEDVLHVAQRVPTRMQHTSRGSTWTYRFAKRPAHKGVPGDTFDVAVVLNFVEDRLAGGRLPERFGRILDERFILETLRAVGRAEVFLRPRTVRASVLLAHLRRSGARLPSEADITGLFGRPARRVVEEDELRMVFQYTLEPGADARRKKASRALAAFVFQPATGRLVRATARFACITLDLHYGHPPASLQGAPSKGLPGMPLFSSMRVFPFREFRKTLERKDARAPEKPPSKAYGRKRPPNYSHRPASNQWEKPDAARPFSDAPTGV